MSTNKGTQARQDGPGQGAVKLDRSLARLHALCVDAVGPLATLLELAEQDQLTAERAVSLTKQFMGNASMKISHERRKWAIEEMNGKLVELAEKDSIYEKAAPMVFGDQFARRQKKEGTNCGPWIGLLTASTFRDSRIFKTAALTVLTEGAT